MHNIDLRVQLVSAQKNANNASEHIQLRASARKRESTVARFQQRAARKADRIYYRSHSMKF